MIIRNNFLPAVEIKTGDQGAYSIRKHSHEEVSIGFVEKGSSRITVRSLHFKMNVNQAVIFPPDVAHLCEPDDALKFRFGMLHIEKAWYETVFKTDVRNLRPKTAELTAFDIQEKSRFFSCVETARDALFLESEAIYFIGNLLFNVFKIRGCDSLPFDDENSGARDSPALVKAILDEQYTEEVRLDDLSELTGLGKYSLLRRFKRRFKLTPHAYMLNKRVNHAKHLLQKGESIAMTAQMCGFFDQSHFIKTFRQYVGMNPTDYK